MSDAIITLRITNAGRSTGLRRSKEVPKSYRKLTLTVGMVEGRHLQFSTNRTGRVS